MWLGGNGEVGRWVEYVSKWVSGHGDGDELKRVDCIIEDSYDMFVICFTISRTLLRRAEQSRAEQSKMSERTSDHYLTSSLSFHHC